MVNIPFIPPANPWGLPAEAFDAFLNRIGVRAAWCRSHTCPCIYAGGGQNGRLPFPGSPDPACTKCSGVGVYWDVPGPPITVGWSFMHLSPSPDEPGVQMDPKWGPLATAEPSVTIPHANPYLDPLDPAQPTNCWTNASTDDVFIEVDATARFTAMLRQGVVSTLPYQQNVAVAATGAVTVYQPPSGSTGGLVVPVSGYSVSGAAVTLPIGVYPDGQAYMVEFTAAPAYVAFRKAGGLPHPRPLGVGSLAEPRRFRLMELDLWLRQKGIATFGLAKYPAPPIQSPYG